MNQKQYLLEMTLAEITESVAELEFPKFTPPRFFTSL
jgi:hypothetical protein